MGSRTDTAYRFLKGEILNNRLRPGSVLPAERLVRQLGISRTPLREAILRLEKEGFIEIRPRMGTFVSHLNLQQIQEIYQVRQTLEGLAARLSAARFDPEALAAVEEELRRHSLERPADYAALSEAGQSLHRLIIESCGNALLTGLIKSLQDHFTRFRTLSLHIPEKILSSHREHLAILGALKRNDGALAERLIQEHFEHAAHFLLDNLLARPNTAANLQVIVGPPAD